MNGFRTMRCIAYLSTSVMTGVFLGEGAELSNNLSQKKRYLSRWTTIDIVDIIKNV